MSLFVLYLVMIFTEHQVLGRGGGHYRQQLAGVQGGGSSSFRGFGAKCWDSLICVLELVPKRTFTPPADRETRKPPGTLRNPTEQRCQDVSHITHINCAQARSFSLELSQKIMPSVLFILSLHFLCWSFRRNNDCFVIC